MKSVHPNEPPRSYQRFKGREQEMTGGIRRRMESRGGTRKRRIEV